MTQVSHWQAKTIANFLEASRRHFGLPGRRHYTSMPARYSRRTIFRSLLIAGSVGSLFGGPVFAEHDRRAEPSHHRRSESVSRSGPVAHAEPGTPKIIEKLP